MAITILDPPAASQMGIGHTLKFHSDLAWTAGNRALAQLQWIDPNAVVQPLARGVALLGNTGVANLTLGIDRRTNVVEQPYYYNFGASPAPGAAIDVLASTFNASGVLLDTYTFTGLFMFDPVGELGNYLAWVALHTAGHDPMLDEILASVRKTYSSF